MFPLNVKLSISPVLAGPWFKCLSQLFIFLDCLWRCCADHQDTGCRSIHSVINSGFCPFDFARNLYEFVEIFKGSLFSSDICLDGCPGFGWDSSLPSNCCILHLVRDKH